MLSLITEDLSLTMNSVVIEKAMSFPMQKIVERHAAEEGISLAAAQEHENELKRFLVLCALNPAVRYGMNGPVDQLWHTFICFTRDYHDFCKEVAGHYLHHQPTSEEDKKNGGSRQDYLRFLADYEKYFGEPAPVHIWPRLGNGYQGSGFHDHVACGHDPCGSKCSGTNCSCSGE